MWMCADCAAVFEQPRRRGTRAPVFSERSVTAPEEYVCPLCGSEEVCPARSCPVCSRAFCTDTALCPDCEQRFSLRAHDAHKRADELYYDLISRYADGSDAAREYMEGLF